MSSIDANEWIAAVPKMPPSGTVVMVRRQSGLEQLMTFERTLGGSYWKSHPDGFRDSIAHSPVIAWRHLSTAE